MSSAVAESSCGAEDDVPDHVTKTAFELPLHQEGRLLQRRLAGTQEPARQLLARQALRPKQPGGWRGDWICT